MQDTGLVDASRGVCGYRAAPSSTSAHLWACSTRTHLNLLMRSKISSCETSGNFLRKRRASMTGRGKGVGQGAGELDIVSMVTSVAFRIYTQRPPVWLREAVRQICLRTIRSPLCAGVAVPGRAKSPQRRPPSHGCDVRSSSGVVGRRLTVDHHVHFRDPVAAARQVDFLRHIQNAHKIRFK